MINENFVPLNQCLPDNSQGELYAIAKADNLTNYSLSLLMANGNPSNAIANVKLYKSRRFADNFALKHNAIVVLVSNLFLCVSPEFGFNHGDIILVETLERLAKEAKLAQQSNADKANSDKFQRIEQALRYELPYSQLSNEGRNIYAKVIHNAIDLGLDFGATLNECKAKLANYLIKPVSNEKEVANEPLCECNAMTFSVVSGNKYCNHCHKLTDNPKKHEMSHIPTIDIVTLRNLNGLLNHPKRSSNEVNVPDTQNEAKITNLQASTVDGIRLDNMLQKLASVPFYGQGTLTATTDMVAYCSDTDTDTVAVAIEIANFITNYFGYVKPVILVKDNVATLRYIDTLQLQFNLSVTIVGNVACISHDMPLTDSIAIEVVDYLLNRFTSKVVKSITLAKYKPKITNLASPVGGLCEEYCNGKSKVRCSGYPKLGKFWDNVEAIPFDDKK